MEQTNNGTCACGSCGGCKNSKCGCIVSMIAKILVIVGALNWGLIGVGALLGGQNLNVVNLILSSVPKLEMIVYVLVGISGISMIVGCGCKKCKATGANCSCEKGACSCEMK